jgi:hypothetical protein
VVTDDDAIITSRVTQAEKRVSGARAALRVENKVAVRFVATFATDGRMGEEDLEPYA